MDASGAMVELDSRHPGCPVLHVSFDQLASQEDFEGIWACAPLLHEPHRSMPEVLERLARALNAGGVIYASFKHGAGETVRSGRLFNDYNEAKTRLLLDDCPELGLIKVWGITDLRRGRDDTV
jgi:hypothetical protein